MPGKQSGGLFSAKGGRRPRTVAAKRPDEVVAPPRHTAFTCSGCPVIATILQLRTEGTTSSVSSLTLRSTSWDTPSATADTP